MRRRTVLSLEQALSLPYATLRFVQLGWRVIRIESTPSGEGLPGDPNRYIGRNAVDDDRRTYFVAPNVGKEAIALNLKDARGRVTLRRLIAALDVDVFCCNVLPGRYQKLGIDYDTLSAAKPGLIWAGISALGPEHPDVPGYDPVLQAMAGFMELTGDPKGPPMVTGVPIVDLKAGDEVYANVLLALAERAETGCGRRIDVSMLQAAASWLITTLPLVDFDCDPTEITRAGRFTTTRTPQGRAIRMQPAGVSLPGMRSEYPFPPKYAEHTRKVLVEAGFTDDEISSLARQGVVGTIERPPEASVANYKETGT